MKNTFTIEKTKGDESMTATYNITDRETNITRAWGLGRKEAETAMAALEKEHRKSFSRPFNGELVKTPKNPDRDSFHEREHGAFNLMGTAVLAAAAQGHIDLNEWASWELANRGVDAHGLWVGFEKAKARHEERQQNRGDLRAALLAVKKLWDKHGLGDEDDESEPVYHQMLRALGAESK